LGIAIIHPVQPGAQLLGIGRQHPRVNFLQGSLLARGVFFLHHGDKGTLVVAHHPAIARGVVELGRQHGDTPISRGHNAFKCFFRDQRDIAKEHQYRTGGVAGTHRLLHRVPRTQLFSLQMALHIGRTHHRLHRLGAMTHDHVDASSVQDSGGLQHVRHQRLTREGMEHFRERGLHPAALSGGQNDHFQHAGIRSGG